MNIEMKKILTYNYENIFYVTGKSSFTSSGAKDFVIKNFGDNVEQNKFCEFSANPKFCDVKKGVQKFKKNKYDVIVAVGGGSVIDMAKLISFFSDIGVKIFKTHLNNSCQSFTPIVAIPTTAGSGSEETHFAVVYNNGIKHSVAHQNLKPKKVILDPFFSFNCSAEQKLNSALDGYCQSIESYWSKGSTKISKEYAAEALKIYRTYLHDAIVNNNYKSFKKIVKASNLAGKAINISKTTSCHALSYFFTSKFGIPHGKAVAMIMPYVFQYHYEKIGNFDVMKDLIDLMDLKSTNYKNEIQSIFSKLGLMVKFKDNNIRIHKILDKLILNVNTERLKNNPVNIDIKKVFNYE